MIDAEAGRPEVRYCPECGKRLHASYLGGWLYSCQSPKASCSKWGQPVTGLYEPPKELKSKRKPKTQHREERRTMADDAGLREEVGNILNGYDSNYPNQEATNFDVIHELLEVIRRERKAGFRKGAEAMAGKVKQVALFLPQGQWGEGEEEARMAKL